MVVFSQLRQAGRRGSEPVHCRFQTPPAEAGWISAAEGAKTPQNRRRPAKIAMLGSFPPLRGISSYCFELAGALARQVSLEFISFKKMYPRFLYPGGDLKDDPTFPLKSLPNLRVKRNLTWYNPLSWLREMLEARADLLHVQWRSLPLAPVIACVALGYKLRGKSVVFTIHNVLGHEQRTLFCKVSGALFRLGDHFIVHTAANRKQLIERFQIEPQRISRVAHGILGLFRPPQADPAEIRAAFGYEPHHRVILVFGAIRPYKGLMTALRAFAALQRRLHHARLLVAGQLWEPWDRYQLEIDRLGIAAAVGTHRDYIAADQVHRYFTAADLVWLPYLRFDSQSGVGSTALAFEKPMIVTAVGGLPELVGDRRFVVPPEDAGALAETTFGCLNDPKMLQQMTRAIRIRAREHQWPAIARQTCSVYQSVLDAQVCKAKAAVP